MQNYSVVNLNKNAVYIRFDLSDKKTVIYWVEWFLAKRIFITSITTTAASSSYSRTSTVTAARSTWKRFSPIF